MECKRHAKKEHANYLETDDIPLKRRSGNGERRNNGVIFLSAKVLEFSAKTVAATPVVKRSNSSRAIRSVRSY